MAKERLIELPKIVDRRGTLSFLEAGNHIPFNISCAYWIYDVPKDKERFVFRDQYKFVIVLSGSLDVLLIDGQEKRKYTLSCPSDALYIPNKVYWSFDNFSANTCCLIIASDICGEYSSLHKKSATKHSPIIGEKEYTVFDCSLIQLPTIENNTGDIASVSSSENIPFHIKRLFYIYDIPLGTERGMHAHKYCHEVLIAASGSFEVELNDGANKKTVLLNCPTYGLYIPPGVWAVEKAYSSDVTCLVLASEIYDEEGYINTYSEFKKYRRHED